MKKDITNRYDIEKVVNLFYEKVKTDKLIGHFFTEVVKVNWRIHLPKMVSFWENVLLYSGNYEGSPLDSHRAIHARHKTNEAHFNRWQQIFNEVADLHNAGPNVEKMKQHAKAIAAVMQQNL